MLSALDHVAVTYEFHSSSIPVIEKELGALELDRLAAVVVPSQIMAREIQPLLPRRLRFRLAVEPNLVDVETFGEQGSAQFLAVLQQAAHHGLGGVLGVAGEMGLALG
ncbi:hypothetical protein, partial [Micrococcus sp. F3Y]|uniref:hypothetical protein n=1 Tax=Micrococcus sp. F3Y TaxID=3402627 RepID=UPI003AF56790